MWQNLFCFNKNRGNGWHSRDFCALCVMPYPPQIDRLTNSLFVLRDDRIAGGTKRRALDLLLKDIQETHLAYAGTIFGHGALALAHACEAQGKSAHLYLSCNDDNHPMLESIRMTNAVIEICAPLPVEILFEKAVAAYAFTFPIGFDMPQFQAAMVTALKSVTLPPCSEIWCPAVSGTLAKALKAAFPQTPLRIVAVTKSSAGEFRAPEKYHQAAEIPPPYPSCPYTDAKVWRFALEHGLPDALIWNTAG
jgi:hypothetical protein